MSLLVMKKGVGKISKRQFEKETGKIKLKDRRTSAVKKALEKAGKEDELAEKRRGYYMQRKYPLPGKN